MGASTLAKTLLLGLSLSITAPVVADAQMSRVYDPVTRQFVAYAPKKQVVMRGPAKRAVPSQYRRQMVRVRTKEAPGTIIIDTRNKFLYYVLGDGEAIRYGVGVGREGFTWKGTVRLGRKAEWPDWRPPAEMLKRRPELPTFMAGGPSNPLGARAMYLYKGKSDTLFRIHGTNEPWTIGTNVSSGCFRMVNEDVIHLYSRAKVGAKVIVL